MNVVYWALLFLDLEYAKRAYLLGTIKFKTLGQLSRVPYFT